MDPNPNTQYASWSRETLVDMWQSETAENNRLRAILLELASRPEITQDTRQWLAGKIRERGQPPVVHGLREDERELTDGLRKWAGKLTDHARTAAALPEGKHPEPLWYRQADSYAEQVQHFLQECDQQFGRTIKDLEEAR